MRLLALHLDRWGPFTDRTLLFPPDKPLVVVHGRNEAGKSSALAGLVDALYGIEARSRFDFLHDYGSMRVGATLQTKDGRRVDFRRRKGNRATLRDDTGDGVLPDDALVPFLGRVDRALFLEAFGLDQDRLRAGARALAKGEGRLGEALLSAAPGLGRLVELRRIVTEEAAATFTERRSAGKPVYAAMDRYLEARKRVTDLSLTAEAVQRARADLDGASAKVAALDTERRQARIDEARLQRLARALPHLAALDRLVTSRLALGEVPDLAADFADTLQAAEGERERLAERRNVLLADRQREVDGLAALTVDAALTEAAERIRRLADGRRQREAASATVADFGGRILRLEEDLADQARRLGFADAGDVIVRRPTAAAIARIRELIAARATLDARLEATQRQVSEARDRLARLKGLREADPAGGDPRPLRASLDVLGALEAALKHVAGRRAAAATAVQRLEEAARNAGLGPGAPIRARRLPARAEVEAARVAGETAGRAVESAAERLADARRRKTEAERVLGGAAPDAEVPALAAVTEARAHRTAAWTAVRAVLFGEAEASASERFSAARTLDAAIETADRLVDRRLAAADKAAAADRRQEDVLAAERAVADAGLSLDAATAAAGTVAASWAARLVEYDLEPTLSPAQALAALDRQADLVALADAAEAAKADCWVAEEEADRLCAALRRLAADVGETFDVADLSGTYARARAAVGEREEAWAAARRRDEAIVEAMSHVEAGGETAARAAEALAAWTGQWSAAVAAIGLAPTASTVEAEAALSVWTEVPQTAMRLHEARDLLAKTERESARFDAAAEALRVAVAPDLSAGMSGTDVVQRLTERLDEAVRTSERRDAARERLRTIEADLARVEEATAAAAAALARLAAAAGQPAGGDLRAVVRLAERAAAVDGEIALHRSALLREAGDDEASLRAALANFDADSLGAALVEAGETLARLDLAHEEAVAGRTVAEKAYEAVIGRDGAESAGQEAETALADLVDVSETWRVLQAASRLAGAVVEEFRRRHQNPVLAEASRFFADLTEGRYGGLAPDYDADGEARLVAVRADDRRLAPEALSEGTRDQLYLSLRLATLLDHGSRAEALPFIGDDLFVTFDEGRTAAGLAALARFGESAQAILFTHHEHVARIAAETLPDRAAVIRLEER
ncbi:ATP-binding protein [Mongoliimonas terrestris]|uniref:ATP-binding protein n=1 Tax=Mongoliimonas terrestris TaxID=1709001 RepID=UPI0009499329|nr:YhaN family protein [Mongoliimonas terrestris]